MANDHEAAIRAAAEAIAAGDVPVAAAWPLATMARVDGAVAELTDHGGGIITAEIRIPGPEA